MVGGRWHIGRKDIISYLTPILDLSDDPEVAWRKIRRWRKGYSLPIELGPNWKPYLNEEIFGIWWETSCFNAKKKIQEKYHPVPTS